MVRPAALGVRPGYTSVTVQRAGHVRAVRDDLHACRGAAGPADGPRLVVDGDTDGHANWFWPVDTSEVNLLDLVFSYV